MSNIGSDKRKIENELFFRQNNEKIAKGFNELKQIAEAENDKPMASKADEPIAFFCECSDENCRTRVKLKPSEYLSLRKNKKQFILYPGHDIPKLERKIKTRSLFQVVEKYFVPKKNVDKLKPTDVNNI
jgi:hypothetical protein